VSYCHHLASVVVVRRKLFKKSSPLKVLDQWKPKDYQLLAHGRWFSPGTPASSTTKTGCHDIAEILLKVALKHQKSNQSSTNTSIPIPLFLTATI
jgi:hypothetical protein